MSPSDQHPQSPSDPEQTSASRAFTQLEYDEQKRIAKAIEKRDNEFATLADGVAAEDKHLFGAYELDPDAPPRNASNDEYRFEVIKGLFQQTDPALPKMLLEDVLEQSFGLLEKTPERWSKMQRQVSELQRNAEPNETYKVLYLGRHGQGYHNQWAAMYNAVAWELKWCCLNGDGEHTWGPDAELTALGQDQARDVNRAWRRELAAGAPRPQRFFCSPLRRALDTMRLSFEGLLGDDRPLIKEGLREIFGHHTCDKRSSKSFIEERFPFCEFEDGFAEEDPLWKAGLENREQEVDRRERLRLTISDIFNTTPETYISITSHGCALTSLLAVLQHPPMKLKTGEMLSVVIKATKLR